VADPPARWVVDPLDGTVNYLYGLHDWAVSIAAEVDGEILVGAVYVPMRGELFTAVRGECAWLESARGSSTPGRDEGGSLAGGDGDSLASLVASGGPAGRPESDSESDLPEDSIFGRVRLQCGPGVPLDQALVATGFGYTAQRRTIQGEVVAALLPLIRDIRRNGAASVDLCAVAANRVDAYYERGLNYWDYAAGALVAAEAGAVVGDSRGGPPSTSMTVAAGPALFGSLSDALAALDAERDG
jgi:myo-inositol-1(or 4)-monophosphatase